MFPHNASIVSHTNIKITYWFVNTFSGYILCNIKISTIFFLDQTVNTLAYQILNIQLSDKSLTLHPN